MKHAHFIITAAFAGLAAIASAAHADTVEPSLTGDWSCASDQSDANHNSHVSWTATYNDDGSYTAKTDSTVRTASVGRYRILSTNEGSYKLEDGLLVTTASDVTAETLALAGKIADNPAMKTRVEGSVERQTKGSIGKPLARRISWTDENSFTLQEETEGPGRTYNCTRAAA